MLLHHSLQEKRHEFTSDKPRANWLPAPLSDFSLYVRACRPKALVTDESGTPPPVDERSRSGTRQHDCRRGSGNNELAADPLERATLHGRFRKLLTVGPHEAQATSRLRDSAFDLEDPAGIAR